MTDTLTAIERSKRMARVKGRDTKPEMLVRRMLHGMGYRYRLHAKDLPGKPDVVFRSRKKAIFVHGCFWHRHPGCGMARMPKSRQDFWRPKLEGNRARDLRNQEKLALMGWGVFVVWECETKNTEELAKRLLTFLEPERRKHNNDECR
jgi:DNA mismatch endonuclease (patch repair protein)